MPIRKRRHKLIADFGGKCQRCGYNKSIRALHFHHIDSSGKYTENWAIGGGRASVNEIEAHPERFILICANCHAEIHEEEAAKQRLYATCEFCGKEFRTEAHRAAIGRGKFCSRECQHAARDEYAQSFASLEKRFWKHVVVQEGCWDWDGQIHPQHGQPYLQFKQPSGKPTTRLAPRISYQIHFGEIPHGASIRRTCGNKKCLNPDHLTIRK